MKYELKPITQKSFYGKAYVVSEDGIETLYSYGTPIIQKNLKTGTYKRLFDGVTADGKCVGITATTLKHIKAFCGMNKKTFLEVEL